MYILAIETTGKIGSVSLIDADGNSLGMRATEEPMGHLRNLMPMIRDLLAECGVSKSELSAVAASAGPGSYTGIRIGVSTARALCQGLGIPAIPVPTLEVFRPLAGDWGCAVIFNARRGQVYGAVYGPEGSQVLAPGPYMLTDVAEAVQKAGLQPVWYGDGIDAYAEHKEYGALLRGAQLASPEQRYQTAEMAADWAWKQFRAKGGTAPEELLPDYMRETEAEQRLKDGSLEKARKAKMAKFMSR